MTIEISHPLYGFDGTNRKVKAVGLAEWRIVLEGAVVQVKITQVYHSRDGKSEKDGKPIYNHIFCINRSEISKYPTKMAGDNKTVLRIIPLEDFYPKTFDLKQPEYYPPKKQDVPQNEPVQGSLL